MQYTFETAAFNRKLLLQPSICHVCTPSRSHFRCFKWRHTNRRLNVGPKKWPHIISFLDLLFSWTISIISSWILTQTASPDRLLTHSLPFDILDILIDCYNYYTESLNREKGDITLLFTVRNCIMKSIFLSPILMNFETEFYKQLLKKHRARTGLNFL